MYNTRLGYEMQIIQRKIVLLLFNCLVVFAITGCNNSNNEVQDIESKNDKIVTVVFGSSIYNIPMNHLSPKKNLDVKIDKTDSTQLYVNFVLPELGGFMSDSLWPNYDPNIYQVAFTKKGFGQELDANSQ